jgi:hypothetical protein
MTAMSTNKRKAPQAGPKPHSAGAVHFLAINVFGGDQNANKSVSFGVAPDADAATKKGPAGVQFALLQNVCTYEDFQIGGVVVQGSLVTGLRTSFPDGTWTAEGYEWGYLANGDRFLSRVAEKGDAKSTEGTWTLVQGTGKLAGITGEAKYHNAPKPGDKIVLSTLSGWYQLANKAGDCSLG